MNEAPVVMFTNYKRADGYEVSLTLRGDELKTVAKDLDSAIKLIITAGGQPAVRGRGGFAPKPVEYIEGRTCPEDVARIIRARKKDGTEYAKCENNKWDKIANKPTGCKYIDWNFGKEGQSSEQVAKKLDETPVDDIDF